MRAAGPASRRLETFEGLVDLFTTISLILITAAVVFGLSGATHDSGVRFFLRALGPGGEAGTDMPEGAVLLLIVTESSATKVLLAEHGRATKTLASNADEKAIWEALEKERAAIDGAVQLYLALAATDLGARRTWVDVEMWLARFGYNPIVFPGGISAPR
jgi:hypothetical protein